MNSPSDSHDDDRDGAPDAPFYDPSHDELLEFYARMSRERWASEPRSPRPRRAVITIVHDERIFFPIWLRYYSRFFAPEDIYVLDHDTTDGSTDVGGFNRIVVSHDAVDHQWMLEQVQGLQHELQARYDVVLICDVDEIVAPDPAFGDLGGLMDRLEQPFLNCQGFEVIHRPELEGPFDAAQPVLNQRHWWFANASYNKPILATEPMEWIPGFHTLVDPTKLYLDPNLYLVHLHRMDYEQCRARHTTRRRRDWNADDMRRGYAAYNLLDEGDEFHRWFTGEKNALDESPMVIERIPDRWADVV